MENAKYFLEEFIGETADDFFSLAQSGSSRMNYVARKNTKNWIVTSNENTSENESFFYFSHIFTDLKLNTPTILNISEDRKSYIQEFLGENTLSDLIQNEGLSERIKILVSKTIQKLFDLQIKTLEKIDYSKTFEYENYNELPITNDLFYFKSFIADVLELPYHKSTLLKEFKKLTSLIEKLQPKGLMIRDFQARNIMVNAEDDVFFIDYQSAMKGPLMYDVVSLLFQAKANFPENFRQEMLSYYISLWENKEDRKKLEESLKPLQLMRFLQVLGAYGLRGLIQKKKHFISSMDQGIKNLGHLSVTWDKMAEFPELKKLIGELKTAETRRKIENLS